MERRTIQLVLVAVLVTTAGCVGGLGGEPASDSATDDSSSDGAGTVAFYVSDEPNRIDDFEHLNVTITKVGFKQTKAAADDGNESTGDAVNGTDADDADEGNETAENDTDADGAADERWLEYDVDERTVDLTELKGENATVVDEFDLPAGAYETVFIYVSDTEGVLTDGTETNVKLPSEKLKLQTPFTVGDGDSIDFVYDIAPHKAGQSGKYILKPVIGQSGTGDDVEIRDIDADDRDADDANATSEQENKNAAEDEDERADGNGDEQDRSDDEAGTDERATDDSMTS
ncbi:DUF4382 domain-containing protein [Natronorubrum aibiense]|uniref:DUF4382 domain-containing protein n=1 Tax=Natronorubrum aibiense TaxID=348826 RepID=A0A5P9P2F9_9EURY|nr:DUF4382 domain-containing protein [Natronorubrum aibiense]QFU82040.1 DUF4382 domain-containing protein [Natronorubrum aibiense]